ncbi:MAG: hypothetical protein ACR2HR_09220 [Euzebya sp.]
MAFGHSWAASRGFVSPPNTTLPEEFRPLRVQEYHQLIQLGVFEGTRVELVGGVLVEMSPQGPECTFACSRASN